MKETKDCHSPKLSPSLLAGKNNKGQEGEVTKVIPTSLPSSSLIMEYDKEREIREQERKRAISIVVDYFDGSSGALINIKEGIYKGWKSQNIREGVAVELPLPSATQG